MNRAAASTQGHSQFEHGSLAGSRRLPKASPIIAGECLMSVQMYFPSAAFALAGLLALPACSEREPVGPSTDHGETIALASAQKPVHDTFTEQFSDLFECGSFTGLSSGELTERSTTFVDKDGDATRMQFHIVYRATITNLTTEKSLRDNANYNGTINLVTGAIEVNGVIYNVKDRANGIRIKDIGRIVFDADFNITFEAGRHDVEGFGDATAQYCAALA
jgi:hypothetical protein